MTTFRKVVGRRGQRSPSRRMLVGQPKRTHGSAEGQPWQEWLALVTNGRLERFRTGRPFRLGCGAPSIGASSCLRKPSGGGGAEGAARVALPESLPAGSGCAAGGLIRAARRPLDPAAQRTLPRGL